METDPRRETPHDPGGWDESSEDEPQHDPAEDAAATGGRDEVEGVEPRPGEGTAGDDVV
jgi:hypothetical protein